MKGRAELVSTVMRDRIASGPSAFDVAEVGHVISAGDGIVRASGVERAMLGEMLEFTHGLFGIALNLEEDRVGVVLLGDLGDFHTH
jgi:F-type H+/Na+-transporting ATPase subunit alpha